MNSELTFAEYARLAKRTDVSPEGEKGLIIPLLGLAGEVGSLLSEHKKRLREGQRYSVFTDQVSEEIGDILWYLASIASKSRLSLAEIAAENLAKLEVSPPSGAVAKKVSGTAKRMRCFDEGFPAIEQFPKRLRVEFREVREGNEMKLEISRDGEQLGQRLTDNAHYTDGYRFHDVFHLSYAMLLGWSPITRRLLAAKRRSKPKIDEIEDGGRAGVTEEGISALVFAHAGQYSYFDGSTSIDYELLRAVAMMARPFEVHVRSAKEWENAILKSFAVWRQVNANRGGVFIGDAVSGTVAYESLPSPRGGRKLAKSPTKSKARSTRPI